MASLEYCENATVSSGVLSSPNAVLSSLLPPACLSDPADGGEIGLSTSSGCMLSRASAHEVVHIAREG